MKTTLLIIAASVFSFKTQAQIGKGRMMLAGSFNDSQSKTTSTDTSGYLNSQPINTNNSFTGTLQYGYFLTDKIMVGVYGTYQNSNGNLKSVYYDGTNYNTSTNNNTYHNFSGGIFSRYYQMLGKSRFAIFGQLTAGYGGGTQTQETVYLRNSGNTTIDTHGDRSFLSIGLNPGVVFFITKCLALETSFGYVGYGVQHSKNYNGAQLTETTNSSFNSNLGFTLSSLSYGINFYFGGKKNKAAEPVSK
jgi:hypothetical protein